MSERFDATVRHSDGVGVIDLAGQLDGGAADKLGAAYAEAAAATDRVLLNFGGTTYMNSTGIALVVELLARARAEHRAIHACGLSEHYRQIFEITRLSDFVTIHPDEATAVAETASVQEGRTP
jgi:anti-anti-sigma factor